MNLVACGISLVGQFLGIENPITIIQMLWVNIIMDTLGGLAFAGEAPMSYYMKEKPKRREEKILTREMASHIIASGLYTLIFCTLFLVLPIFRTLYSSEDKFFTAFYALFIFFGIFNSFAARSERLWIFSNIEKNKGFILIMILVAVVQVLMIYFGGTVFRSVALDLRELLTSILLAFTILPFDIIRRILVKLK